MNRCPEYRGSHDIYFRKFHSITQVKLWSGAKLVVIWNGTKLVNECVHLSRIEIKWLFPIKSSEHMNGKETTLISEHILIPWHRKFHGKSALLLDLTSIFHFTVVVFLDQISHSIVCEILTISWFRAHVPFKLITTVDYTIWWYCGSFERFIYWKR